MFTGLEVLATIVLAVPAAAVYVINVRPHRRVSNRELVRRAIGPLSGWLVRAPCEAPERYTPRHSRPLHVEFQYPVSS